MTAPGPTLQPACAPAWVLSHPGTNGFISSWGAHLAGTGPNPTSA
jgi:hypothetical protein